MTKGFFCFTECNELPAMKDPFKKKKTPTTKPKPNQTTQTNKRIVSVDFSESYHYPMPVSLQDT